MLEQRKRRGMGESLQGLGIKLPRQDERAFGEPLAVGAGRGLVEHRHHLGRPMRKRSHHGGGGKEDVQNHDHLARQADAVELLLPGEDVDLVIEVDSSRHQRHECGATRS
jgi:hypothetical protein